MIDADRALIAAMSVRLADVMAENARLRKDLEALAASVQTLWLAEKKDREHIAALESTKFLPNKYLVASLARAS